jgi:hypothetical protein
MLFMRLEGPLEFFGPVARVGPHDIAAIVEVERNDDQIGLQRRKGVLQRQPALERRVAHHAEVDGIDACELALGDLDERP